MNGIMTQDSLTYQIARFAYGHLSNILYGGEQGHGLFGVQTGFEKNALSTLYEKLNVLEEDVEMSEANRTFITKFTARLDYIEDYILNENLSDAEKLSRAIIDLQVLMNNLISR